MLIRSYKEILNSDGAIVVEAALVMIIVLIVVFSLLYLGIFQVQYSIMYYVTQNISQEICDDIVFPGYDDIFNGNKQENIVISNAYAITKPYRYLGGIKEDSYNVKKSELKDNAKILSIFKFGDYDTNIQITYQNLSYAVEVTLSYYYNLPKFVETIGVDRKIAVEISAVSFANDATEFVRNVDLTVDLANELLEKYKIKDKFSVFYEKIRGK